MIFPTIMTTGGKRSKRVRSRPPSFVDEEAVRGAGYIHIAGVDEVGRGCLAGPVVASAVLMPPNMRIRGVRDSKELTSEKRERLAKRITAHAVSIGYGICSPEEIDTLNILRASLEAMRRALAQLTPHPDFVLVDGNQPVHPLPYPQKTVIGGDARCHIIAVASVLAKVERDRLMSEIDRDFPGYGLSDHKGYATKAHIEAIRRHGPSGCHRRTFRLKSLEDAQPSFFAKS